MDPDEHDDLRDWHPEMRLYEKAEYRLRTTHDYSDDYRVYQVKRFFATIEGFLKGNLDLTGRHQMRLDQLRPLWNAFFEDYYKLKKTASLSFHEHVNSAEILQKDTVYTVKRRAWKEFRMKWKIPKCLSFSDIVDQADSFGESYLQLYCGSGPKIQQLCLLDLPNEILDCIISLASLRQAMLLSATCKRLYRIGAPYLFRNRTLRLSLPNAEQRSRLAKTDDPEVLHALYQTFLSSARQRLFSDVDFLLSRPDITQQIQDLFILNELFDHRSEEPGFYSSIAKSIDIALNIMKNLRILSISSHDLWPEYLTTLSQLPHLSELTLIFCRYSDALVNTIYNLPLCTQIRMLTVHDYALDGFVSDFTWVLLTRFPQIRILNYKEPRGDMAAVPPPPTEVYHLGLFNNVRYLLLTDLNLPSVLNRIRTCRIRAPLSITHFSLSCKWGQSDEDLIELLEAFVTAPLQVLAIHGLLGAHLELLECITLCFPDLLSLTLIRQESRKQHRLKTCTWPHASWEYASYFLRFNKLEYFCWNFRDLYMEMTYPAPLLILEKLSELGSNVGAKGSDIDDWVILTEQVSDNGLYDYTDFARLFGAYCSSLKTFSVFFWRTYTIVRGERGTEVIHATPGLPPGWYGWQLSADEERTISTM